MTAVINAQMSELEMNEESIQNKKILEGFKL